MKLEKITFQYHHKTYFGVKFTIETEEEAKKTGLPAGFSDNVADWELWRDVTNGSLQDPVDEEGRELDRKIFRTTDTGLCRAFHDGLITEEAMTEHILDVL